MGPPCRWRRQAAPVWRALWLLCILHILDAIMVCKASLQWQRPDAVDAPPPPPPPPPLCRPLQCFATYPLCRVQADGLLVKQNMQSFALMTGKPSQFECAAAARERWPPPWRCVRLQPRRPKPPSCAVVCCYPPLQSLQIYHKTTALGPGQHCLWHTSRCHPPALRAPCRPLPAARTLGSSTGFEKFIEPAF